MSIITMANLPQAQVSACIVGDRITACGLAKLGMLPILTNGSERLPGSLKTHVDMLFYHLGGNNIISACSDINSALRDIGFNVLTYDNLSDTYPLDVALNAACIGGFVICNEKYTCKLITNSPYAKQQAKKQIVSVNQGYAKCSTLIVDENSIVTADNGIHNAAIENGICSLKISQGHIVLEGYNYGFIGGCGVKIAADTLYFTGDIGSHPDCRAITNFISDRGINIICEKRSRLYDIGSIIPLTQNGMF